MLNKDICKKCLARYGHEWGSEEEWMWGLGEVWCPLEPMDGWLDNDQDDCTLERLNSGGVRDDPPGWCPYAAEHVVSEGDAE